MNTKFYKETKFNGFNIIRDHRDIIDVLVKVQKYLFPFSVIIKEIIIV